MSDSNPRPRISLALDDDPRPGLPAWAWLGLPIVSLMVILISPVLGYERWKEVMVSEYGVLEITTLLILAPAVVFGIGDFRRRRELPGTVGWLMLLGALCAFYFLGEEASWGQHYFGYETPESIAERNYQKEFNLHNLEGFGAIFNNVPRQAMLVGVIVGGLILPFVKTEQRNRPDAPSRVWYWLIPRRTIVPAAFLAVFYNLPQKILELTDRLPPDDSYLNMAIVENDGEVKEFYFAMVMLLYLWSVHRRLGERPGE